MPQTHSSGREFAPHSRRPINESHPSIPGADVSSRAAAISAAERGWAVFPCRPGDKRPAIDQWEQRACVDPDRIARYWPSDRHNVGIACGPSGLVVLDLDTHGALPPDWQMPGIRDGRDVLAQLCEWAGQGWPATYMAATPSSGWHLYFTATAGSNIRNSASLIGPLVDVRARGGYVVGVGSVVDGKPYERLDDCAAAPLPGWLYRMLTNPPGPRRGAGRHGGPDAGARLRGLLQTVSGAAEGQRNSALHWAACRASEMVAARETDATAVVEALVSAAMTAGLGETEARRTIASGMNGGAR